MVKRKAFLANKAKENATNAGVLASKEIVKRGRSSDELLKDKSSKKVRNDIGKTVVQNLDRVPISDLLKLDLDVSIVDTNQPDWKICESSGICYGQTIPRFSHYNNS